VRKADTGYVWNDRGLTDEEWKARIDDPPMTRTFPVIRVSGPDATVVVIGPRGEA
jgi:site-specific DNA recombinase